MTMSSGNKRVPVIFRPSVEVPIDLVFDSSKFKACFKEIVLTELVHGIKGYFNAVKGGSDGQQKT